MVGPVVLSLLLAMLFTLLLVWAFGRRGPGPGEGLLFFFLILFLFVLAGGVWAVPTGPVVWGMAWAPFLILAVLVLVLLLAVTPPAPPPPPPPPPPGPETTEETVAKEAATVAFGCVFWLLVLLLIGTVIARYAIPPAA
ncbi:MAG: hypothetical protein ACOCX4_04120 [Planctomycetota bacterium]